MIILLLISLFILNQCVAFRISSPSLSNFSYKKKSIVSMNLFNNNYDILYQNSLLLSSDDDIKNQLLPYQTAVVLFIFVAFGTLQSKLNKATSIKQEIDKLQFEIKRLNILIINNNENKTIISNDIKQKEERIKDLRKEFRKGN